MRTTSNQLVAILATARKIFLGMCTNVTLQMKMIARFSTPCLKVNVISQQKIQNGTYQENKFLVCVFVDTCPLYSVVITY